MRGKGEGTITKRKDGRFEAALAIGYNDKGNPKRIRKEFRTKREAATWLADQITQRAAGNLREPSNVTVRGWIRHYLAGLRVRANTLDDYEKALKIVEDDLGDERLRDLTPARLQAALTSWGDTRTPYQNRKTIRQLKACLAEAARLELISRNPAAPLRLPKTEPKEILVWTGEEAQLALQYAREVNHRLFPYLHVNLTTGLRREEMLGLRWADVDLDKHELRVRQTVTFTAGKVVYGDPKTRKARRTVDLDEETVGILREWRVRQSWERQLAQDKGKWVETDLVFTSPVGQPWAETYLGKVFRQLLEDAKVPRIRLYDLRHSYASLAYEAGVPLKVIGDRLGHTNVAFTLQTYVHSNRRQRKAAALPASALFRRADSPAEGTIGDSSAGDLPGEEKDAV